MLWFKENGEASFSYSAKLPAELIEEKGAFNSAIALIARQLTTVAASSNTTPTASTSEDLENAIRNLNSDHCKKFIGLTGHIYKSSDEELAANQGDVNIPNAQDPLAKGTITQRGSKCWRRRWIKEFFENFSWEVNDALETSFLSLEKYLSKVFQPKGTDMSLRESVLNLVYIAYNIRSNGKAFPQPLVLTIPSKKSVQLLNIGTNNEAS